MNELGGGNINSQPSVGEQREDIGHLRDAMNDNMGSVQRENQLNGVGGRASSRRNTVRNNERGMDSLNTDLQNLNEEEIPEIDESFTPISRSDVLGQSVRRGVYNDEDEVDTDVDDEEIENPNGYNENTRTESDKAREIGWNNPKSIPGRIIASAYVIIMIMITVNVGKFLYSNIATAVSQYPNQLNEIRQGLRDGGDTEELDEMVDNAIVNLDKNIEDKFNNNGSSTNSQRDTGNQSSEQYNGDNGTNNQQNNSSQSGASSSDTTNQQTGELAREDYLPKNLGNNIYSFKSGQVISIDERTDILTYSLGAVQVRATGTKQQLSYVLSEDYTNMIYVKYSDKYWLLPVTDGSSLKSSGTIDVTVYESGRYGVLYIQPHIQPAQSQVPNDLPSELNELNKLDTKQINNQQSGIQQPKVTDMQSAEQGNVSTSDTSDINPVSNIGDNHKTNEPINNTLPNQVQQSTSITTPVQDDTTGVVLDNMDSIGDNEQVDEGLNHIG